MIQINCGRSIEHSPKFIAFNEKQRKKTYLEVIDMPVLDRPQIMQELSLMGITARAHKRTTQ